LGLSSPRHPVAPARRADHPDIDAEADEDPGRGPIVMKGNHDQNNRVASLKALRPRGTPP
jgi:hypothetical protein